MGNKDRNLNIRCDSITLDTLSQLCSIYGCSQSDLICSMIRTLSCATSNFSGEKTYSFSLSSDYANYILFSLPEKSSFLESYMASSEPLGNLLAGKYPVGS